MKGNKATNRADGYQMKSFQAIVVPQWSERTMKAEKQMNQSSSFDTGSGKKYTT